MYKNAKDKGITLTSLVVTVVILLILSTIAYETGKGTLESAKLSAYRAEMTIMQEEVDKLEQEIRQGKITESALTQYGQDLADVEGATQALQNAGVTDAEEQSNYKYYDVDALKQLGIENVENGYLINVSKRSVVSVSGVKYKGEKYYTLSEVPGGKYIVEKQPIESSVTFDVAADVQGNDMKIVVSNITYIGNVKKGSIYYRHENDEPGKWIRVTNETTDTSCTIDVLKEGTFQVKVVPTTDKEENNVVPVEVSVHLANYTIAETGIKYVTLAEAINSATSGQTITQTRNCVDTSDAKISGKSIILNNNNRNITKKTNPIVVESGATLEIAGKGGIVTTDGITAINNHGTLTVGKTTDALSTSSPLIQGGNYGIETDGVFNFYNGVIKGTTAAFNTAPTTVRSGFDVIEGTETISGTTYKIATLGISTTTVNAPTNVAVSTAGIVTWTDSSNATGYQISIDGTNYTDATSGIDYLETITETAGEKTIYVKAINSDTENYESTNASIATVTTTVYTVTFTSNDTEKGTVAPTSKNVIAGATYEASGNTLTLKGITTGSTETTLATITATAKNGCNLTGWSSTSGNIITDTTITAMFLISNYQNTDTLAYYETLATAMATVQNNQTIKVLNSVTETAAPTLSSGKTGVKLDMNGKTTTLSNITLTNNGELDIYSSVNGGKLTGTIADSSYGVITNNETLTTSNTTGSKTLSITNTSNSSSARVIVNKASKTATLNTNTTLTFETALSQTLFRYIVYDYGILNIQGATLTNTITGNQYDQGIYIANAAGRVVMTSGSINTWGTSIVNISGTGTDIPAVSISGTTSGTTITSKQLAIKNSTTGTIDIDGGDISSTGSNNNVIYNGSTGAINISGGNISSNGTTARNVTTGTINISGGTITSTNNNCISNSGTVNISGGTLTASSNCIESGTINILGGNITSTGSTGAAVAVDTGTAHISGDTTNITSAYSGIRITTGTATITGGTITSTNGSGVYLHETTGTLTLGTDDGTVTSSASAQPSITGTTYGVYVYGSGTINFYDGVIKGAAGKSISAATVNTPTGYSVLKTTEGSVETAILEQDAFLKAVSREQNIQTAFLDTSITRDKITKISFATSIAGHTVDNTTCWDVGTIEGKVLMWIAGGNATDGYEIVIGQNGGVRANENSSYLLSHIGSIIAAEIDLTNLNTSKATNMSYMFDGCHLVSQIDVSGFYTSNVTNMYAMFRGCNKIESLNVSSFNTSNVTDMGYMFCDCTRLTELDLNNFNTSNVTNMSLMFANCYKMEVLDVGSFDTSNVTNMSYMFSNGRRITTLDLSSFDTSNVTNMSKMFKSCHYLTTIYASNKFVTTGVTTPSDGDEMFPDDTELVGGAGTTYDSNNIDYAYAHIDGGTSNPGYFTDSSALHSNPAIASVGKGKTIKVYINGENLGTISVETQPNGSIATVVKNNDNTLTVTGVLEGTTSVTIKESNENRTLTIPIIVRQLSNYSITALGTTTYYETLEDAVNEALTGQTIVVEKDYVDSSIPSVSRNITLNTNGKTITKAKKTISVGALYGVLLITGDGTITNDSSSEDSFYLVTNYTTTTIEGTVNITNTKSYAIVNNSSDGIINITGGTISSGKNAIYNNLAGTVNITGGTVTSTTGAIINNSTGTVNASGGTITGATGGGSYPTIYNNSTGTIEVSGTAQITNAKSYGIWNKAGGSVNVKGGTITTTASKGIQNDSTGTITVSGGTITTATNGIYNTLEGTVNVTGGTILAATGAITNNTTGEIHITGGTITGATGGGSYPTIYNNSTGTIEVLGTAEITNAKSYGIWNRAGGTATIIGGTITSTASKGIQNESTGTITLGSDDGTVTSSATAQPSITGTTYGVYATSGTFNFYDGVVKGATGQSISKDPDGTPTGYVVKKTTSGSQEIATLALPPDTLRSTSSESFSTSKFLNGTLKRNQIEKVTFVDTGISGHSTSDANCWDVSSRGNGEILAWYEDSDSDGYYEVTIGSIDGRVKANTDSSYLLYYIGYNGDDITCIDGIDNFDVSEVTNMNSMFYCCGYTAMTSIDLGDKFDTSNVTNMSSMFYCCGYTAMTSIDLGDKFDTSNVTNMSSMFYCCGQTAMASLDLGDKFDTSNVTNMNSMFKCCGYTAMTSLDLGDKFDTSNVRNMEGMFECCGQTAMTSIDLGDKFDTSNVTNMNSMFRYCGYTAMTSIDLGDKFDTSNVTSMSRMFEYCGQTAMTSIDLGDKFDTSNVTDMLYMFQYCGSMAMTSLDLGDKFDTSNVTNMSKMFQCCGYTAMTSIDLGDKFDTSNVTDMSNMFSYCGSTAMTSLDLGDKFDTSNVTSMSSMFEGCTNLTTIYATSSFVTTAVKIGYSTDMFFGDANLVGGAGTVYDSSHRNHEYAHIDGGTSNPGYFTNRALAADPSSATVNVGSTQEISFKGARLGTITIETPPDSTKATATINNGKLIITGVSVGSTSVTVKEANNNQTVTIPITVNEANYSITTADTTTYAGNLADAITAASSGSTIKLLRDYTDTSSGTISQNVTLDLQTYTLTRSVTVTVNSGVTATITGSAGSKLTTGTTNFNTITNAGTLTIDGDVTIEHNGTGTDYYAIDNSTAGAILNVKSGTITSATYGIYNNNSTAVTNIGDSTATLSTTNPTISGGTYGVYNNSGKWTYYNGAIQGTTSSFYDGDVEANGGLEGGVRTDYIIVTGESGSYKTAHLEKMTDVTTPWLPAGASYTNTDLNTGVTMKDSYDNEWTWVVVPKTITASASLIGANEDPTGSNLETALINYAATVVTNRGNYTDTWVSEAQSGFTSDEYTSKKRNMLNGIKANGGFWIGKYEMGYLDTPTSSNYQSTTRTAVVQKDAYPYNFINLPNSAIKTEQLAMQTGGDGSMLFGTQWDLTIGYLVNRGGVSKNSVKSNSTNWGNYQNKELTVTASTTKTGWPMGRTGTTYNWETYTGTKSSGTSKLLSTGAVEDVTNKLNIVDLAGNYWEWTMEACNTNSRAHRGRQLQY